MGKILAEIRGMRKKMKYDIRRDAFLLIMRLAVVLSIVALVFYTIFAKTQIHIIIAIFITMIYCTITIIFIKRNLYYRTMSIITVLVIDVIILPIFILFGGDTRGSTPIWFAAGIMVMFFILETRDFLWMFCLAFYVCAFMFARNYVLTGSHTVQDTTFHFFGSFAIAFFGTAAALVLVVFTQEKNFKRERQSIDMSREIEKNAGAAKSRFLANMSHEIRTPMNSIIGLSELLLKGEMDDVTQECVTTIKGSAYDLLEIIDDVLMYSKLDSGKMHLLSVDFRFDDLIHSIMDTVSTYVEQKDLKIRIRIDHNIPKVINGDDIRIKQVLLRVIFISLELTENGRLMIDIESTRDPENEMVRFKCVVSDTGCGLSQVDLDAIYGAYDTYDSRQNSNLKGIGLKFSICRELLSMMNGAINVRSIEGVGLETEFTFECGISNGEPMIQLEDKRPRKVLIYVADSREHSVWKAIMEGFEVRPNYVNSYFSLEKVIQATKFDYIFIPAELYASVSNIISMYHCEDTTYVVAQHNQAFGDFDKCRIIRHPVSCISVSEVLNDRWNPEDYAAKLEETAYVGKDARILVVDDNSVNLKVAMGIFAQYKINIDIAKSGQECLQKMEKNDYQLILMDMVMPEMSGAKTLEVMRSNDNPKFKEVPVIALTANSGGNIREEILEQGFQEYLAKPIKSRYLEKCLIDYLPPGVFNKVVVTKKKEEQHEEPKAENVLIPERGLANIGYNQDSYNAILNTYYSEGLRKIDELPKLMELPDIQLFTTDVHGIKSSSASIGAMVVSGMFKELEFAGKDNKVDFIRSHYDEYVEAFKKILGDVKEYLIAKGAFEFHEEENTDALKELQEETLTVEMLEELKDYIDKMNLKECDRIVEDWSKRNFGDDINQKLAKLKTAYEMFDFHQVKQELTELLEK